VARSVSTGVGVATWKNGGPLVHGKKTGVAA
jgi:hypothetical protein